VTAPVPYWFHADQPGPATHALVIGTSTYPHRPLGLTDLPGAATSAHVFAQWLRDRYPGTDRRLGSIRLLLAPSAAERAQLTPGPNVAVSNRANVHRAVHEWARDSMSSPDNVAILYVCGHGVQETDDGALVFCHDAGGHDPLDAALDVAGVRAGMVGDSSPNRQWYFADACRVPSPALDVFEGPLRGSITLKPRRGRRPAHRPVFFAAEPGALSWQSHQGSIFMRALQSCLELDAFTPLPDSGRWGITAQSLLTALRRRVPALARVGGRRQTVTVGGSMTDEPLIEGDPPSVPVTLLVRPAEAESIRGLEAEIFDGATAVRILERRQLPITDVPVRGGIWTLAVTIEPPCPPYLSKPAIALFVRPPRVEELVTLA
jgi:hypothetical protein